MDEQYTFEAMWRREPKPDNYEEVAALIERVGVPNLLRCIAKYADLHYGRASDKHIAAHEQEEAKDPLAWLKRKANTQLDRERSRWMGLKHLEYQADNFEERTLEAAMSDEEYESKQRAEKVAALERQLAEAKA